MIDTIAVVFHIHLGMKELEHWKNVHTDEGPGYRFVKYSLNSHIAGSSIKATYHPPNDKYVAPRLKIELSLPYVLYGSNIAQLEDVAEIEAAAILGNEMIASIPGIPDIDLREGILCRIDLCHNYCRGDMVQDSVKAMFNLDYPKREIRPYPYQGIQFKSEAITTKFYNQYQKLCVPEAIGHLRQETTIRNSYIAELMHVQRPTLRDITSEWVDCMLQKDLERLYLDKQTICPLEVAHEKLIDFYRPTVGDRLYGYLKMRQSVSLDHMLAMGYKKQMIYRNNKKIAQAGVALTCTESVELPPLKTLYGHQKVMSCRE